MRADNQYNDLIMRGHIRTLEKCPKCRGPFQDTGKELVCPECLTSPRRYFIDIYMKAWKMGCKGITTFNASGKRFGILNEVKDKPEEGAEACYIDPTTGEKSCGG